MCGSAVAVNLLLLPESALVLASVSKCDSGPAVTSCTNLPFEVEVFVSQAPVGVNSNDSPLEVSDLTETSGC